MRILDDRENSSTIDLPYAEYSHYNTIIEIEGENLIYWIGGFLEDNQEIGYLETIEYED